MIFIDNDFINDCKYKIKYDEITKDENGVSISDNVYNTIQNSKITTVDSNIVRNIILFKTLKENMWKIVAKSESSNTYTVYICEYNSKLYIHECGSYTE